MELNEVLFAFAQSQVYQSRRIRIHRVDVSSSLSLHMFDWKEKGHLRRYSCFASLLLSILPGLHPSSCVNLCIKMLTFLSSPPPESPLIGL